MENNQSPLITIGQLADCLQSEILNSSEKLEEVVEHLMVGAMCTDPSPLYFSVKPNKAVITRSDRADIQLGALETSIKCLILSGGQKPIPSVLSRAEEKSVPVLLVEQDTPGVVAELERAFSQVTIEAEEQPEQDETGDSD